MADSDDEDFPDVPPPEVPEEFAATYREAYRRAMEEAAEAGPAVPDVDEPVEEAAPSPDVSPEPGEAVAPRPGAHRVTEYRAGTPLERARASAWFVPLVAVLLVLALVLGGWLVARSLAADNQPARTPAEKSGAGAITSEPTAPKSSEKPESPRPAPHRGPVARVKVTAISATCTLEPGIDSAGRRVEYAAGNAVDGNPSTAWRCEGDAVRQRLALRLPKGTEVAAVGLVPGYAKTDPASRVDRYAENNRITRVRWLLAEGVTLEQRLDPAPGLRDLQVLRIPRTATDRVVLEILAVEKGSRGATAISEIRISSSR